jgi:hypothetical protein
VIQGIHAAGYSSFINFAGQHHMSAWYEEDIPRDWAIVVSNSGRTANELGVEWLKHFIKHTEGKIVDVGRVRCSSLPAIRATSLLSFESSVSRIISTRSTCHFVINIYRSPLNVVDVRVLSYANLVGASLSLKRSGI